MPSSRPTKPKSTARKKPATIAEYLAGHSPDLRVLGNDLRKLVKSQAPGTEESVNPWGIPTFSIQQADFCVILGAKTHLSLGFARGTSLPDPHGLLEGTGKNMRHTKLRSREDLQRKGLKKLIAEAARLAAEGGPSMKMGRKKK